MEGLNDNCELLSPSPPFSDGEMNGEDTTPAADIIIILLASNDDDDDNDDEEEEKDGEANGDDGDTCDSRVSFTIISQTGASEERERKKMSGEK